MPTSARGAQGSAQSKGSEMRRNRKVPKKMSVIAGRSVQVVSVMIMAFTMVILNMLANSSCRQLNNEIRVKERQLAKLEDQYKRESMRMDELKTPESLDWELRRHGLAMHTPKPEQVVRMTRDGRLYPGQISVARAAERSKVSRMASYTPAKKSTRPVSAPRVRR